MQISFVFTTPSSTLKIDFHITPNCFGNLIPSISPVDRIILITIWTKRKRRKHERIERGLCDVENNGDMRFWNPLIARKQRISRFIRLNEALVNAIHHV